MNVSGTVTPLQLSWLAAPLTSWMVAPVQLPCAVPAGTLASTAPGWTMLKSAAVQAGLVASACLEKPAETATLTLEMYTEPEFGLSKLPEMLWAGPPG